MKFNFKKIIIAIVAVLMVTVLMAGCVSGKVSTATLVDYEGVCFETTIKEYFEGLQAEATIETDIDYKWSNGWKGEYAPSTDELEDGEKAVTFLVKVTSYDEETQENEFAFFMGHNEADNTLQAYGGYIYSYGETSKLGKTEIDYFIALLDKAVGE